MSKTTAVNKIPYPEDSDAPDGPTQIKALAELLDTLKWGSRNLKPTVGVQAASADLTLTTSYQDVAGTTREITPAVASILKVTAIFDFFCYDESASNTWNAAAEGTLRVDAEDQAQTAILASIATSGAANSAGREILGTVAQVYAIPLTAAAHTIKLRGKKSVYTDIAECRATGTRFLYELIAS